MKPFIFFIIGCVSLLLEGCSNSQPSENQEATYESVLKDCPVVAHYEVINGDSVLICDFTAMKEERDISISSLLSSYEIVALDTCKETLSSPEWGTVVVSPHYIAVNPAEDPVRLFDRKTGKFLRQIGDIGQGPTEYPYAGNIQIEEDSNIVLISAKRPNRLIQYELSTGKYQKEYKLISPSLKKVYCDLKNREIIGIGYPYPTFDESVYNFWKQTFDGKMIQGITGIEQVGMSGHNRGSGYLDDRTNCYQVMLWDTAFIKSDTLYHYNIKENRLVPRFTTQWGKNIPIHTYTEFPHYYYMEVWNNGSYDQLFLIDKLTGRGAKIKLKLDMFGNNMELARIVPHIHNSYGLNILFDPLAIADYLKEEDRQRRIAGKVMNPDSLQNENSWVFIGNW